MRGLWSRVRRSNRKPVFQFAIGLEKRKQLKMGRSAASVQAAPRTAKVEPRPQVKEGHRDTVEAIVVAFILALVVRGFEAQAFVIPTGSMAPTLMGRHKEARLSRSAASSTRSMRRKKPRCGDLRLMSCTRVCA